MSTHPSLAVIARYAGGDAGLDDVTTWTVEVHLETCPDCRARLAGSTTDTTRSVLERVAAGLDREIAAGPAPVRRRRAGWSAARRRWLAGTMLPWLAMTAAVLCCAALLSRLQPELPSLVLLLAPVAPLPGVAVAWSRRTDPARELIASTPAAGLLMLLRRTAAVLVVLVPVLALAGAGTGLSLALTLLPCLAFTATTIALGGLIGVHRAAVGLAAAWTLAVVLPSLVTAELPVVLHPASTGVWALVAVAAAALITVRAGTYRALSSSN